MTTPSPALSPPGSADAKSGLSAGMPRHLSEVLPALGRLAGYLWAERQWLIILIPYLLACWLPMEYSFRNWGSSASPMMYQPLVPLVTALLIWQRRERLISLWKRLHTPSPSGAPRRLQGNIFPLLAGCVLLLFAFLVHVDSFFAFGLILIPVGVVYRLYGPTILKAVVGPLLFLLLMVNPPDSLISIVIGYTSHITASTGSVLLSLLGTHTTSSDRFINFPDHILEINDIISGANLLGLALFFAFSYVVYTRRSILYSLCFITFTVAFTVLLHLTRIVLIAKTSASMPEIANMLVSVSPWFFGLLIAGVGLYAAQIVQILLLRYLVAERKRSQIRQSDTLTGRIDRAVDPVFRASGKGAKRLAAQQRKLTKYLDNLLSRLFSDNKKKKRGVRSRQ